MSASIEQVVGVGVLIRRGDRVLLGLRLGSRGEGTYAPPGGLVEAGESVGAAALREVAEETALEVHLTDITVPSRSDIVGGREIVSNFVVADWVAGEALLREPEKCAGWRWWPYSELPAPLYGPLAKLLAGGFRL